MFAILTPSAETARLLAAKEIAPNGAIIAVVTTSAPLKTMCSNAMGMLILVACKTIAGSQVSF